MSALPRVRITPDEYLDLERRGRVKSEYIDGDVYAMAGASRKHILITFNLVRLLGVQLVGRSCEGYGSDMRVWLPAVKSYYYPDVSVVCGEPRFQDADVDTLLNPTVVIEVLSPSTADFDRGLKFEHYRTLNSLQEYVLVAQDTPHIVRYTRQADNTWLLSETRALDGAVSLASIGCALHVSEVYDKVQLES